MKVSFIFVAAVFLTVPASHGAPPDYGHLCLAHPSGSSGANHPCYWKVPGKANNVSTGLECATDRDRPFCPSGWTEQADCVNEHGIRACTSGEESVAGYPCMAVYQECNDGLGVGALCNKNDAIKSAWGKNTCDSGSNVVEFSCMNRQEVE